MTMQRTPTALPETASQTAGPFVHIGLAPRAAGFAMYDHDLGQDIAGPNALGTRIRVEGRITDGTGAPVTDAVLEVWQANAAGHYAHPDGGGLVEDGFRGWGRVIPDFTSGAWGFDTVKPGPSLGLQAPHITIWIVARGINIGLTTRLYFADEAQANAADPVLNLIAPPARRNTLIAHRSPRADQCTYTFNICLQGPDETVFFDI
jgi:protocatechuate 3,4-dioxygenase alpha subunit